MYGLVWRSWRISPSVTGPVAASQRAYNLGPSCQQLSIGRCCTGWNRAHKKIISPGDQRFVTPKELAQPALHAVAHHCGTNGLSHSQPEADEAFSPVVSVHGEVFASQALAMTVTAREVGWRSEALIFTQALVHSASDG
jgi:hypothetical protein